MLIVYLTDDCHWEDAAVLSLVTFIKHFTGSNVVNVGFSDIGGGPLLASI